MVTLDPIEQALAESKEETADEEEGWTGRKKEQDRDRYDREAGSILDGFSHRASPGEEPAAREALTARFKLCEVTSECVDVMAWVLFAEWSRTNGVRRRRDNQYRLRPCPHATT